MPIIMSKFCKKCNKVYSKFITVKREDGIFEIKEAPDLCKSCLKELEFNKRVDCGNSAIIED